MKIDKILHYIDQSLSRYQDNLDKLQDKDLKSSTKKGSIHKAKVKEFLFKKL